MLRLRAAADNMLFEIDEAAMRCVVARLHAVSAATSMQGSIDLASLLNLPGMVQPVLPDEKQSARIKGFVLRLTAKALDKLERMREAEGVLLEADLSTTALS